MPSCPCPAELDEQLMRQAIGLARRAKGRTAPNPCVGALFADAQGRVLASGWHHAAGLPHAEVEAIRDAREKGLDPAELTLYVTLEPCNHQGRTPPCTRAILEAGVKKVVIGTLDPNPHVEGGGAAFLRQRGVEVVTGALEQDCKDLIADFLLWQREERPYVVLKLAATLDGRIATRTGHSQWVTGEAARREVHRLRGQAQAVLVGGNTFYEDNPRLDCRLERMEEEERLRRPEGMIPSGLPIGSARLGPHAGVRPEPCRPDGGVWGGSSPPAAGGVFHDSSPIEQPLAVVLTSRLPDPGADFTLLRERADQTIFLTSELAGQSPARWRLQEAGVRVLTMPEGDSGLDLARGLAELRRELGVWTLFCEGGGKLAASLLGLGLVDELRLFLAPKLLADGLARPMLDGLAPETMDQALGLRLASIDRVGEDVQLVLHCARD